LRDSSTSFVNYTDTLVQAVQSRQLECVPSNAVTMRIITFFVLSILCHASTLHTSPGQHKVVIIARSLGMIVSPVMAVLFSLMALGRMIVSWIRQKSSVSNSPVMIFRTPLLTQADKLGQELANKHKRGAGSRPTTESTTTHAPRPTPFRSLEWSSIARGKLAVGYEGP